MSKGRYRAYPEYRESGVDWLGQMPQHWELSPLKYLAQFSGGGTPNKDTAAFWNGNTPWVSPKDMKGRFVDSTIDNVTPRAIQQSSTKLLAEGALLLVVRSGILQHSIPAAINRVPVTLNQDMKALRFGPKMTAHFAQYFVIGNQRPLLLEWCKQGATVESIEQELLGSSRVPIPPLPEQTQIAKFLDHETAKIDRLIEKQEALIRLLKEKRQAVISHAVTKGLNPHAPLKDSGIEWLGQVPAHWSVLKLGHLVKFKGGAGFPDEFQGRTEDEIPFYKVGDLSRTDEAFTLTGPNHTVTRSVAKRLRATIFETGTIVFAKVGAALLLKRFSLLPRPSCIDNNMMGAEVDDSVLRGFLLLLLPLVDFDLIVNPGAVPSVNGEQIASIFVALPPSEEQAAITKALRVKNAQLTGLIERANSAITLLQERRTALISAAVAGKIDVRHWQPPVVSEKETTAATVLTFSKLEPVRPDPHSFSHLRKSPCLPPGNRFNPSSNV